MDAPLTYQPKWNAATLWAFRFIFVYFLIYIAPFPFSWIPYAESVIQPFTSLFFSLTESFGKVLFDAAYVLPPAVSGSGDTMHHYVQLLLIVALSGFLAIIWSAVDWKRDNYEELFFWFLILLRYYLAANMLVYGFAKVFRTQFPPIMDAQLEKSYGDSSPMNLLWTFMGYSWAYSMFAGLAEVVGGLLLLFRRTKLLGAMVVAAVMIHVVMLNLSFDVPVKLFSTNLLVMAIVLMIPDYKRLLNFFILNQSTHPAPVRPLYNTKRKKWIYIVVKTITLVFLVTTTLNNNLAQRRALAQFITNVERAQSFDGTYDVEEFKVNHENIPSVEGETRRWKKVVIRGHTMKVYYMDGAYINWHFMGSRAANRIIIYSPDLTTNGTFTIASDSPRLSIEGLMNNDTLKIVTVKNNEEGYLLMSRGFHWVNEYPFNQ